MPSSPTPDTAGICPAAAIYLAVAAIAGTTLAGIVVGEILTGMQVNRGVSAFFAAIAAVAGCGYVVRSAEDRVTRRLNCLMQRLDDQRQEGYAEGYVAAAAGRPHLTAVNDR